jgi:hypothetical protein
VPQSGAVRDTSSARAPMSPFSVMAVVGDDDLSRICDNGRYTSVSDGS